MRPFNNALKIWIDDYTTSFSYPLTVDQINEFVKEFQNSNSEFISFNTEWGDIVVIRRDRIIKMATANRLNGNG